MAKSARPKVIFSMDPTTDPIPPEPTVTEETLRNQMSPFDNEHDIPPQEFAIMLFPIPTYKAITDEANRRNMKFVDALQQAISEWIIRGYTKV